MPLIRLLIVAVPLIRRALRNPAIRRRLGLSPLDEGGTRRRGRR